jgi:hypothetical protein
MSAPNQVPAKTPVRKRDDVDSFVRQKREGNYQCFIALTSRHRTTNQTLSKQVENAVVAHTCELHPAISEQQAFRLIEFGKPEIPAIEQAWRVGETH